MQPRAGRDPLATNPELFKLAEADSRYRDDYIEGLGDDIESDEFQAVEYRINAEVGYQWRNAIAIFANANNLKDQPQVSCQGIPRSSRMRVSPAQVDGWREVQRLVGLQSLHP